jgi:hypothetical protein
MKRSLQQSRSHRVAAALLAGLTFAVVAQAGLADKNKTPAANSAIPQIECTTPDGRVSTVPVVTGPDQRSAALLMDQETLSCALQEGETTFVIKLPETSPLDRFTFVNENAAAAGELKISVSNCELPAASEKWVEVDGHIAFHHKRLFNVSMVGVDARYMKLAFNIAKGERLAGVRLYDEQHIAKTSPWHKTQQNVAWSSNVGETNSAKVGVRYFDLAALRAEGHVVYVSSNQSPATARMIDDNNNTGFQFAASDKRPTAIVELAQNERVHCVTARYRAHSAGKLDVYLLDDISRSAPDINYRRPVASTTAQNKHRQAAVDFDPQGARYVAIRFTPSDSSTFGDGFEITEISAFADHGIPADTLEAPDRYAATNVGATFSGEGGYVLSNSLGTIAIRPAVPIVSP